MVGEKVSDVQRIEALEAMVDDLQSNFLDLKRLGKYTLEWTMPTSKKFCPHLLKGK